MNTGRRRYLCSAEFLVPSPPSRSIYPDHAFRTMLDASSKPARGGQAG
jgi:hypothetical protein